MKTKDVFRPADSRYTIQEIVDPIYMSIEQYRQAAYIPDNMRSRIIIVETVPDEVYMAGYNEAVEKCMQILEAMRVPEDGRHEWRDRHNDCIDRCKAEFAKEFNLMVD